MRDRRGGLLTVAVIVGAIWAVVQAFMTDAIAGQKAIGLTCTEHLPKDDLTVAAWGAVIAVLIAFAAAAVRWRRLATVALLVEAGFVVAWIVIGGFGALDCVVDV